MYCYIAIDQKMKFLLFALPLCYGFSTVRNIKTSRVVTKTFMSKVDDVENNSPIDFNLDTIGNSLLVSSMTLLLPLQDAWAKGGEYGLLEGRIGSMMHPFTMLALFGTSIYSGYLGLQWRKLREIGDQLKNLNNEIPKLSSGSSATFPLTASIQKLQGELSALNAETETSKISSYKRDIEILSGLTTLDSTYNQLVSTRKDLISANLRDKHWLTGSVLLGVGVGVSLLGAMNTYLRAGKLFPGPHLYAGAAITGLWAAAAALVPAMQKGNEGARVAHIALNSVNVALFAWQVYTGLDIMVKVWEKTSWP